MEEYMKNYDIFNESVVYDFDIGDGGLGDYIKFFMSCLETCIKNKKRLYKRTHNLWIDKYIKLKYDKMYVNDNFNYEIIKPHMLYNNYCDNTIKINEVFYFTDDVKQNSKLLFPAITNYISIHLRLGDKYLETDKNYILCKEDTRQFSQEKINEFIETHSEPIFFCCDNMNYKLKLKQKYNIIITNCDIGHSSLSNTTEKQILDAVTELFILTNSKMIFGASNSGFSLVSARFNDIPYLN